MRSSGSRLGSQSATLCMGLIVGLDRSAWAGLSDRPWGLTAHLAGLLVGAIIVGDAVGLTVRLSVALTVELAPARTHGRNPKKPSMRSYLGTRSFKRNDLIYIIAGSRAPIS